MDEPLTKYLSLLWSFFIKNVLVIVILIFISIFCCKSGNASEQESDNPQGQPPRGILKNSYEDTPPPQFEPQPGPPGFSPPQFEQSQFASQPVTGQQFSPSPMPSYNQPLPPPPSYQPPPYSSY